MTRNSFSVSCSPHVRNPRQSRILDSTPWIPDSRYWILDSLSVELGFRIPIIGWIPDFLELKSQDSGFQRQKFVGFWNPRNLTWGDPWRQTFSLKVVPEANLTISDCVNFLRPGRSHLNETVCQVSSPGRYAFPRYKREKFCCYGPFRGKNKGDILRFTWFRATKEIPKDFVGDRCVDIITKTKHDIPWTSKLCCKLYQSSKICSYRHCHQTESKIETMAQNIKRNY